MRSWADCGSQFFAAKIPWILDHILGGMLMVAMVWLALQVFQISNTYIQTSLSSLAKNLAVLILG